MDGATPAAFTTAPRGARLPKRIARPPRGEYAFSSGRMTSASRDLGGSDGFAERAAGDGERLEVQQSGARAESTKDGGDAARAVDVFHVMPPRGRDFADVRDAVGDGVDFVEAEIHAGLARHGEGVEDGIRRASHGHVESERVFKGGAGENVRGPDVPGGEIHDGPAGGLEERIAPRIDGEDRAVAGQREPQGLAQAVHGIGGEHAGTRAAGRAGLALDVAEFGGGDRVLRKLSDGFEHRGEVQGLAGEGIAARGHGAAGNEDRRDIHPRGAHHHAGHDFVAIGMHTTPSKQWARSIVSMESAMISREASE